MRRTWLLLVGSVVVGVAFGRVMSQLPIPHDAHVFWIGNLCAPWLVLAFLAGRVQRRWGWAVLAGVMTQVGCLNGFDSEFLFVSRRELELPADSPTWSVAMTSVERQMVFIAPSLWAAALVGGLVYGLLGWWWRTRRPVAAALALGLPFLAEPALWPLQNGYYKGPWPLWTLEVAAGLALISLMAARRRRPARSTGTDPR